MKSPHGPAPRSAGTSRRTSRSPASATTCAMSPSPKATRSKPSASSATQCLRLRHRRSRRPHEPASPTPKSSSSRRGSTATPTPSLAEHDRADSLAVAARIELGLRAFLTEGGFGAFTDTFEDLHGMGQLPGIATFSASWPQATASAAKATGRQPPSFAS